MENLLDLLNKKVKNNKDWKSFPIFLRWHKSNRMTKELEIIAAKINYLLSEGARSKVNEWLSSDQTLTQITAERYLLDSLRGKNTNFEENFTGGGVDAYLNLNGEKVGIEVTTINQSISEWILIERLLTYLQFHNFSRKDAVEITYDNSTINGLKYSLNLIEKIGEAIVSNSYGVVEDVTIKKISSTGGYISWNNKTDNDNFFINIEQCLESILSNKSAQLNNGIQNILFIGVNQLPIDIYNPSIFRYHEISKTHPDWIDHLEHITIQNLPEAMVGVCYFVYTLNSEEMMYPLRIFWKNKANQIPIQL